MTTKPRSTVPRPFSVNKHETRRLMRNLLCLVAVVSFITVPLRAQRSEEYNFLAGLPDFARIRNMLPDYLNALALAQLAERGKRMARFSSSEDVQKRKSYIRARMLRALGGLPERTPLNARTVGVLNREGYRIEKVIFESQPRFYVTANLYVPTRGQGPYPAILFPLGHERGGKANPTWQQFLATAARRGYVCLTWDPIGQGERIQIYDPDFQDSQLAGSTTEHTILGVQCLLAGDSVARYTIWDGIRALDYLVSRKEVDSTRIACTGNSGGGTHTAYLSALDDRIQVAIPSCYVTSWERLLATIGPQDAEQCLPPWLQDGLDHADFVHAFAPKPYLILSAIRDFFSISGARATYREAQSVYALSGAQEKISMFEWDDGHGYNHERRMAAYRWLGRWLRGQEDREPEQPIKSESAEDLQCTESGQVVVSLGGETVTSLNLRRAEEARPSRPPLTTRENVKANREALKRSVERLSGYAPRKGGLQVTSFGLMEGEGCRIQKLIYETEPGILVPSLLCVPQSRRGQSPAVIYVHGEGKAAGAGEIARLVTKGFVVLAVDVRGWGETHPPPNDDQSSDVYRFFGHYDSAMTALLVGKTLVGMRAEDLSRGVDLLAARPEVDGQRIYAFGVGPGAVVVLHAAVIDDRIQRIALEDLLVSYASVVERKLHRGVFESIIQGVLKEYDLPDLAAALAPRPVSIINARDPLQKRLGVSDVRRQYSRAVEAFRTTGAEAAIKFQSREPGESIASIFEELQ
jgi:cephalosporin-C deacetylase-like acetyl esterase